MKKLITIAAAAIALTLTLSGCNMSAQQVTETTNPVENYDFSQMELVQLEEPQEGQTMAVIKTSVGEIKAVLYPEYCPNTVTNFINRAKEGYYDNTNVFLIFENACFLAGSNSEDGKTGRTDDGNPIKNEYSVNLWPFKGSLIAYNDAIGYGDSRFMVANSVEITEEELKQIREIKGEGGERIIPEELIQAFVDKGVLLGYSGRSTVFGQTIEGLDVVEKIVAAATDPETSRPVEAIIIESVTITEYHKS